jgi:5-formyltetrahydrofolate cyclo-ligase
MAQPTPETRAARRRLRELRMALPPDERDAAERAITRALRRLRIFRRGSRVAVYLAMPGEVNLAEAIASAAGAGCMLYVPRVTSRRRSTMAFVPLKPGARLRKNVYGIAEPETAAQARVAPRSLDVILMPVVGFDRDGNRLGMGAGYYDRALKHLSGRPRRWRRPRLIGLAFACQEIEGLTPSRWDVALDVVVTEREIILPAAAEAHPPRRSTR